MKRIYFDHSATTPPDPAVIEAMLPFMSEKFGNASSIHSYGREAKVALEDARESIADFLNANVNEIYFTGCGTESDNIAIIGVARQYKRKGKHIITSQIEHHAVLHTCQYLEKEGFEVSYLKPDEYGVIHHNQVADAIRDDTILISIMHANNEVGTINDIEKIGNSARQKDIRFHTDAVQTFGKLPIDLRDLPVDLMAISGHKIYGPKGIGMLFIRRGKKLAPITFGGAHERNMRPGTENIPGIIGLAKAVDICKTKMQHDEQHLIQLSALFREKLEQAVPRIRMNGHPESRLPGILNFSFEGVEGEAILFSLDLKGIAASSGSACTSGSVDPSHVLKAMGVKPEISQSSIRFSLGRDNTTDEVEYAIDELSKIVEKLRSISALE